MNEGDTLGMSCTAEKGQQLGDAPIVRLDDPIAARSYRPKVGAFRKCASLGVLEWFGSLDEGFA